MRGKKMGMKEGIAADNWQGSFIRDHLQKQLARIGPYYKLEGKMKCETIFKAVFLFNGILLKIRLAVSVFPLF